MKSNYSLNFFEKFGYGLGDVACSMSLTIISSYLLIFCTDILGISIEIVSFIFLGARIWDAIDDPLSGYIIEHTKTRIGKYRPFILIGSVFLCSTSFLLFTNPNFGQIGKIIWIISLYLLNQLAYSFINTSYNCLPSVMTKDSNERVRLNSFRFFLVATANSLIQYIMTKSIVHFGNEKAFSIVVGIFSLISFIFFIITFLTSKEKYSFDSQKNNNIKLKDIYFVISQNKPYIILLLTYAITTFARGINAVIIVIYFKYVVKDIELLGEISVIVLIPTILCYLFSSKFINKFTKKTSYKIFGILYSVVFFMPFLFGVTPKFLVVRGLIEVFCSPMLVIYFSCLSDTIDYGIFKTKIKDVAAIYSSGYSLVNKASHAIGGAIAGFGLKYFGYTPNMTQSTETITGITILFTIVPTFCYLLGIYIFNFYELENEKNEIINIQNELKSV